MSKQYDRPGPEFKNQDQFDEWEDDLGLTPKQIRQIVKDAKADKKLSDPDKKYQNNMSLLVGCLGAVSIFTVIVHVAAGSENASANSDSYISQNNIVVQNAYQEGFTPTEISLPEDNSPVSFTQKLGICFLKVKVMRADISSTPGSNSTLDFYLVSNPNPAIGPSNVPNFASLEVSSEFKPCLDEVQ